MKFRYRLIIWLITLEPLLSMPFADAWKRAEVTADGMIQGFRDKIFEDAESMRWADDGGPS